MVQKKDLNTNWLSRELWNLQLADSRPIHATPEEFRSENGSNVFRPRNAWGIWKRNSHRSFWICVCGNSVREITWLLSRHRFRKAPFSKRFFRPHENGRPVFLNSSGLKSVFEKRRISVNGRPNSRNKAWFSNSSFVVRTARPIKCINRSARSR